VSDIPSTFEETRARVNIVKQVNLNDHWKLVSIPHDKHGRKDWRALADGRYFIDWWERGKRKCQAGGVTVADALEASRHRKHILEGRALGVKDTEAEEDIKRTPLM
jgi:hypothetical protein